MRSPLLQLSLLLDPLAVDKRAVGAARILDRHGTLLHDDRTMLAADEMALRPEVTALSPADEKLGAWDGNCRSRVLAADYDQFDFHQPPVPRAKGRRFLAPPAIHPKVAHSPTPPALSLQLIIITSYRHPEQADSM